MRSTPASNFQGSAVLLLLVTPCISQLKERIAPIVLGRDRREYLSGSRVACVAEKEFGLADLGDCSVEAEEIALLSMCRQEENKARRLRHTRRQRRSEQSTARYACSKSLGAFAALNFSRKRRTHMSLRESKREDPELGLSLLVS
ncbi:nitrogen assimilation transcription factor [Pseudozyma hubeiensis SY62]|uniref:Nitrogen assimilation transcription factor n=1 Tax=Pseudozyma hubeiensis (strain SY62) TaxID=1305764 RepID=R9P984_PSEHS|nr:nitrogen assimilation transcription factor [Pseudozyma hubeiensis SY62]GAC97921.1 nitrogen assimilation transcription factor [Pseudozyma hubeiensis SY62]